MATRWQNPCALSAPIGRYRRGRTGSGGSVPGLAVARSSASTPAHIAMHGAAVEQTRASGCRRRSCPPAPVGQSAARRLLLYLAASATRYSRPGTVRRMSSAACRPPMLLFAPAQGDSATGGIRALNGRASVRAFQDRALNGERLAQAIDIHCSDIGCVAGCDHGSRRRPDGLPHRHASAHHAR